MGRMRSHRKDRRPGNRPMTDSEWRVIERAKAGPCIPCLVQHHSFPMLVTRGEVAKHNEWDHHKEGNLRVAHLWGWSSCQWHHKRRLPHDAATFRGMTRKYGPSLMDGSMAFHAHYGTAYELILTQYAVLFPGRGVPVTGDRATVESVLDGLTEDINRRSMISTFDPEF